MKDEARARELATAMVGIGRAMGKGVRALLTTMDEPLGRAVGNAVEVSESIACLRGEAGAGAEDLMEVTCALGAEMLLLAGVAKDAVEARAKLAATIRELRRKNRLEATSAEGEFPGEFLDRAEEFGETPDLFWRTGRARHQGDRFFSLGWKKSVFGTTPERKARHTTIDSIEHCGEEALQVWFNLALEDKQQEMSPLRAKAGASCEGCGT
jgi:hypothetical protein